MLQQGFLYDLEAEMFIQQINENPDFIFRKMGWKIACISPNWKSTIWKIENLTKTLAFEKMREIQEAINQHFGIECELCFSLSFQHWRQIEYFFPAATGSLKELSQPDLWRNPITMAYEGDGGCPGGECWVCEWASQALKTVF